MTTHLTTQDANTNDNPEDNPNIYSDTNLDDSTRCQPRWQIRWPFERISTLMRKLKTFPWKFVKTQSEYSRIILLIFTSSLCLHELSRNISEIFFKFSQQWTCNFFCNKLQK
jgi:hypothetical protein